MRHIIWCYECGIIHEPISAEAMSMLLNHDYAHCPKCQGYTDGITTK